MKLKGKGDGGGGGMRDDGIFRKEAVWPGVMRKKPAKISKQKGRGPKKGEWALLPPIRRNSRPRPNPSPPIPVRVGGPPIVVYMLQGGRGVSMS